MKTQLAQISAITKYEFRMQWRQRHLKVMTLAMLVVTVVPAVLTANEIRTNDFSFNDNQDVVSQAVVNISFTIVGICLALLIPVVMADSVPRDKALKIWDILHTSSLQTGPYLIGKVLGGIIAVLFGVIIVAVLGGVSWWLAVSKYDFGWYLEAWLIGAFGIAFINISLVMLLSAPLGNRRIAVVLAIFFCYAFPMLISFEPTANWLDLLNPIRPGIFFRYAGIMDPAPEMLPLALTLIGGAVQVIIVGILVTWWLRNHEA